MRAKELNKKLSLNKKTIAHLDNDGMGMVMGGAGDVKKAASYPADCQSGLKDCNTVLAATCGCVTNDPGCSISSTPPPTYDNNVNCAAVTIADK